MSTEEDVTVDSCHQCVVPENIQLPTPWRAVRHSKGEEGISKANIFKVKCAPKLEFPERSGGEFKPKSCPWEGGHGYFLKQHSLIYYTTSQPATSIW